MSQLAHPDPTHSTLDSQFQSVGTSLLRSEQETVVELLSSFRVTEEQRRKIVAEARQLVQGCRRRKHSSPFVDKFLQQYGLSSQQGVALLSLVEALLRIPDKRTADVLALEKLAEGNWAEYQTKSSSMLVNLATFMMVFGCQFLGTKSKLQSIDRLTQLDQKSSPWTETMARHVMLNMVNVLSLSFVCGETIETAIRRSKEPASFDMLGEGARTYDAAERYFQSYMHAVKQLGIAREKNSNLEHGLSVKLTALYPKIHPLNEATAVDFLDQKMSLLCKHAAETGLALTIDGEESNRCEITLKVIERLVQNPDLKDWNGLGVVVQAYAKRAIELIDWLAKTATANQKQLKVRLVKGAYWDTEIKVAQEHGLETYPVFTCKENTDLCYLACVSRLFEHTPHLFPQFASHNAHTISTVYELGLGKQYEFQRLYGMGQLLYEEVQQRYPNAPRCRVYSPVGNYEDLVPYLMRRLLENGANSNFVQQLFNEQLAVEEVIADPYDKVKGKAVHQHPKIPLPLDLYGKTRINSRGIDFGIAHMKVQFRDEVSKWKNHQWKYGEETTVHNPAIATNSVGAYTPYTPANIERNLVELEQSIPQWSSTDVEVRATSLESWAAAIEENRAELCALLQLEAGKTIEDAVTELREAEDFCRYYAAEARKQLLPEELPSPTGETNVLYSAPRGLFVCISPWNFPASIFVGPVAAALVTGNVVAAKPAPETSLIALRLAELAYEHADIPRTVFKVMPGSDSVGKTLVTHPRVGGVAFTGSQEAAKSIARSLANLEGPIVPLIAETGGVNAMIVDSTAQFEHAVDDIIHSAFKSAGQRCSALRLLCVQEEIADPLIEMIHGAMDTLSIGDPSDWSTDVGPVIGEEARNRLETAISQHNPIHRCRSEEHPPGHFVPPTLVEVTDIKNFDTEHFGPVLGVYKYQRDRVESMIQNINQLGYGLTFGIHSRINSTIERLSGHIKVGNTYVNRGMTGAVVGTQPFGGEGLSGTGPKAGGPRYLSRFTVERVLTRNETATGGNLKLMQL